MHLRASFGLAVFGRATNDRQLCLPREEPKKNNDFYKHFWHNAHGIQVTSLILRQICFFNQRILASSEKEKEAASAVSELLPFLEYDIHRQLLSKLRIMGMNAVFGLKWNLHLSERLVIATAYGSIIL